jgi:hypothetical protein
MGFWTSQAEFLSAFEAKEFFSCKAGLCNFLKIN